MAEDEEEISDPYLSGVPNRGADEEDKGSSVCDVASDSSRCHNRVFGTAFGVDIDWFDLKKRN